MFIEDDPLENERQWENLLHRVAAEFDDLTLKRGYQYYKQGRIELKDPEEMRLLIAVVEGTKKYRTQVDVEDFGDSECSCPVGRACKHMAAVLMEWAGYHGYPVHALANAKTNLSRPSPLPASQKSTDVERLARDASQIPGMSVRQWLDLFDRCLAPIAGQVRNTQYVKQALGLFYKIKPALPPVAERLFELNALLFLMRHAAETQSNPALGPNSYLGYFTHLAVTDLHEAAMGCLDRPLPEGDEPLARERLLQTADILREAMLEPGPTQEYELKHYGRLWETWLALPYGGEALYEEELRKLEEAETGLPAQSRSAWNAAVLRMRFGLADDDRALALLRGESSRLGSAQVALLTEMLDKLAEKEEWPRLLRWLTELGPLMSGRRQRELETYAGLWDAVVAKLPEAEPRMWEAFEAMMPSSQAIYEERLLGAGRYEEWIDIQLSFGRDPLDYRATELAPIEKEAPHALLPFYHQAVERYVSMKNRASYKSAVKLLKRLAKLYKKMKREERWIEFYELFELRHSRLRALQEELRKGKLS
ncbi:SWIM zinc finger domain-containing protein [Cohnella sp. GCM10020058]|uniref:SWIM zinc finger family protein n=1 Tax=Cohnella sp. GCM10020058 TaxID=3317330 RepID=UPI00363B41A6